MDLPPATAAVHEAQYGQDGLPEDLDSQSTNAPAYEAYQAAGVGDADAPHHRTEASQLQKKPEQRNNLASYSDHRVDIDHVLFSNLGVSDDQELRQFLRQPWVGTIYTELLAYSTSSGLSVSRITRSDDDLQSRSQHVWKLDRAGRYLSSSVETPVRYMAEDPDTTTWTEDDFDIRFLVRAVVLGSAPGQVWYGERARKGWRAPCEKSLHLLLWFKWLQRTTQGNGKDMQRLQRKRNEWLGFLATLQLVQQGHKGEGEHQGVGPRHQLARDSAASQGELSDVTESIISARQDLQRQLFLVTDDARNLYLRNQDTILSFWGVTSQHAMSCLLVPSVWASSDPVLLASKPDDWPVDEPSLERLVSLTAEVLF